MDRITDYDSVDRGSNPLRTTNGHIVHGERLVCKTSRAGSIPAMTSKKVVYYRNRSYIYSICKVHYHDKCKKIRNSTGCNHNSHYGRNIPACKKQLKSASIAQLVEQLICNQ